MLGSIINYLTRNSLAVAVPTPLGELGISTQQYSWIVGAFQGAIMLQPLPSGSSGWRSGSWSTPLSSWAWASSTSWAR